MRLNRSKSDPMSRMTSIDYIKTVGGWKSIDSCRRYVKTSDRRASEVGARLEGLF